MCEREDIIRVLDAHGFQVDDDIGPCAAVDHALHRIKTDLAHTIRERNTLQRMVAQNMTTALQKGGDTRTVPLRESIRAWLATALTFLIVTVIGVACISWAVSTIARWFT